MQDILLLPELMGLMAFIRVQQEQLGQIMEYMLLLHQLQELPDTFFQPEQQALLMLFMLTLVEQLELIMVFMEHPLLKLVMVDAFSQPMDREE